MEKVRNARCDRLNAAAWHEPKPVHALFYGRSASHPQTSVPNRYDPRKMRESHRIGGSPMNPIEQAWSKLKTYLLTAGPCRSDCEAAGEGATSEAARSRDALEHAIPDALRTIIPSNAQGWFRHAGYALN